MSDRPFNCTKCMTPQETEGLCPVCEGIETFAKLNIHMLLDIGINAAAVPGALRIVAGNRSLDAPDKVLLEVAAQVIDGLLARVQKQDADMANMIRSFAPRQRASGSKPK